MKFSTKAIHIGQKPERNSGTVIPPIYMTSTFIQDAPTNTRATTILEPATQTSQI